MKRAFNFGLCAMLAVCFGGCLTAPARYKKHPSLPQYDGEIKVTGLKGKVDIYRDGYGVPHIFADNEDDLFFAVGYVQAQDRLWEMVLFRAGGQGRLSELVGKVTLPGLGNTFELDRHQRVIGIKWLGEAGEELLKEFDPQSYRQIQAYCDGVNEFLASRQKWDQLPLELQILRVRPEPWRVADIISYGMVMGWELGANMDDELIRYFLVKKYGDELAWQLYPIHWAPKGIPIIVPNEMLKNKLSAPRDIPFGGRPSDQELGLDAYQLPLAPEAAFRLAQADMNLREKFLSSFPYASNNWVVAGKLTENKHAMLANDPHLEHMQPAYFYPMHIKSGNIDAFGVAFAGVPYPVLGHTRKLAWGLTTPPADVQDLFIEKTDAAHPGQYLYKGEWRPFTIRNEIIKVRLGPFMTDKTIEIKQSVHGPIINDIVKNLPPDTPPLAMRWAAWDFSRNLKVFDALVASATAQEFMTKIKAIPRNELSTNSIAATYNYLLRGSSIQDFIKAADAITVPNQNWVAADADGHIAYIPAGLVPIRKKGIGVMPVPGDKGEFDWTGFIPLLELPHAIDPARGYMATANNTVVDFRYYPYVFGTDHDEGWRAWRIEELIKELAPISMDDMKRIQNDVQVKKAVWEIPFILAAVDRQKPTDPLVTEAAEELRKWDCEASLDSTAAVIFFSFTTELRRNVLSDEVPAGDYEKYLDSRRYEKPVMKALEQGQSPLFDDKRTTGKVETMDDMIIKSLRDAMAFVHAKYGTDPKNREWGKLHQLTFEHPLSIVVKDLSVGPFPHVGAYETVRNAGFSGKGDNPFKVRSGPVLRHIMDMNDPDHAQLVIDGSVSGQWLSPHYKDMHPLYNNSQYLTATMTPELVIQEAKHHLILR